MRKLILLAPVLLVVLASGCTIPGLDFLFPGGGATYDGSIDLIVINSLSAVPSSVSKGQSLTLYADVKNLQDLGSKLDIKPSITLYDFCVNLFELDSSTPASPTDFKIGPQETKTVKWRLKARSDINLKTSCTIKVRVKYTATTEAITNVVLINSKELERKIREGESWTIPSPTPTVGPGPVKPIIQVEDPQPISVGETPTDTVIRLSAQLKNVGSGFISGDGKIAKNLVKIIVPQGLTDTSCAFPFQESASPGTTPTAEIELVKKESSKKICEIKAGEAVSIQKTYTLKAQIENYNYEFRKEVNVIVNPT